MAKSWVNRVKHVQPNEPVAAGVVSRPDRALASQTAYLRERVDAIESGTALIDFDAAVSLDVVDGLAVYWNAVEQRYEPALAGMEVTAAGDTLVATAASDCVGLVLHKKGPKVADILLFGLAQMSTLANAIGDVITPGRYYLSGTTAGGLTQQRPPVSVPVALVFGPRDSCNDVPLVLVLPQLRDFQQDHIHYRIPLVCRPAGTHVAPTPGEDHVITDADVDQQGWLPADHASFNGTAPTGAVFGYNISAHTSLSRVWPPIPVGAASLLFDKGDGAVGATDVPLGATGLAVINRYGIWWMSNCYGDVPWPTTYDTETASSSSVGSSESSLPECPRVEQMRLDLVFLRMTLGAAGAVVTDLSPAPGSPIQVLNCDGDPASTGSLQLALDLTALILSDTADGSLVFKELGDEGLGFRRGRVIEGLIAGSDNVSLSSDHPKTVGNTTVHQGLVQVDVNLNLEERELPVQIARLNGAVDRVVRGAPVLAFPEGRDTALSLRLDVPTTGVPTNPQVQFRATIFGLATGTLPPLTMEYKLVERPGVLPSALPAAWATPAPEFDTEVAVTAMDVVEITTPALDVTAGDTIIVEISRAADSGYDAEVNLLRFKGVLIGG